MRDVNTAQMVYTASWSGRPTRYRRLPVQIWTSLMIDTKIDARRGQTKDACKSESAVRRDAEEEISQGYALNSILYSQGFSTKPCLISAFAKRGDILVADRGIDFVIRRALQISRSTVRWFDHNDLKSLEGVPPSIENERRKCRGLLLRRFILAKGIFGAMVD
ncbi:hypothetical protein BJY52DRAFT_392768 [Lactarius psammicola]|nr:hypothetical protein BJY52DRAFT_392768 [Lactarius psammicola]